MSNNRPEVKLEQYNEIFQKDGYTVAVYTGDPMHVLDGVPNYLAISNTHGVVEYMAQTYFQIEGFFEQLEFLRGMKNKEEPKAVEQAERLFN